MNKQPQNTENEFLDRLRTPTPALASGGAFSLACVLPTVIALLVVMILGVMGLTSEGYAQTEWWKYISYIITPLAFLCVTVLYLRYRRVGWRFAVRSQKCAFKYFAIAMILQVGLFALAQINGYFLEWLTRFGYQPTEIGLPSTKGFAIVGVLFTVALLPAVFEELVFRGVLLHGLQKNFSPVAAILLCGGLFAFYHQRPEQTLYQFACGATYALLALRAGSILPTVLAHFVNNTVIIVLHACGITAIPTPIFIVVVIVAGLCLLSTLFYLIFIDKSTPLKDEPTQKKDFFLSAFAGIAIILLSWFTALFTGF